MQVAVVLAGCGRADGAEIHESVSILIHLSRLGAAYRCFAPDKPQHDVINHATGKPEGAGRNCLVEAARISRGEISALEKLRGGDFDALVFAGGFGAAKNFCTYALDGPGMRVDPQVQRVIREFHALGKPIGLCCIAPVLAAMVLGTRAGGPGVTITLGPAGENAQHVNAWGSKVHVTPVDEACVDEQHKIVTTPAYMYAGATAAEIFTGIGAMIERTIGLLKSR